VLVDQCGFSKGSVFFTLHLPLGRQVIDKKTLIQNDVLIAMMWCSDNRFYATKMGLLGSRQQPPKLFNHSSNPNRAIV
jgi:hypothetical protein